MTWDLSLAVAAGGFVGAPARYLLDRIITDRLEPVFPWGTWAVNISGSLLLGLLTGLGLNHHLPVVLQALLATGFCGAYTTFSTFSFETVRLIQDGQTLAATVNVLASLCVGLVAAGVGLGIGLLS